MGRMLSKGVEVRRGGSPEPNSKVIYELGGAYRLWPGLRRQGSINEASRRSAYGLSDPLQLSRSPTAQYWSVRERENDSVQNRWTTTLGQGLGGLPPLRVDMVSIIVGIESQRDRGMKRSRSRAQKDS